MIGARSLRARWAVYVATVLSTSCSDADRTHSPPCTPPGTGCDPGDDCRTLCECQASEASICATSCAVASVNAAFELRVLELTNAERATGNCCGSACYPPAVPLSLSPVLRAAARLYAADMSVNGYLSHTDREGRTFVDRATQGGYAGCVVAENVSRGPPSPEAVVSAWMESPAHCQNILWPALRFIGVGYAVAADEYAHYWVQSFGG